MKIRLLAFLLLLAPMVKAQDQFYSTVDVTANILEVAFDKNLVTTLSNGALLTPGVRGSTPNGSSWYYQYFFNMMWVKLNKTVSCSGQDVENFVLLPMTFTKVDANSYPNIAAATPWYASSAFDEYAFLKTFFTNAYVNNLQVKITKVVCGSSQQHPIKKTMVPVAYIQGPETFTIVPPTNNSLSNSAWINGVQVTQANAAPTNAITTTWSFVAPAAAAYDVYAHWVSNKNAVSAISYGVDGQTMKNVALDQNINAGIWVKLIKNTNYTAGNHTLNIAIDSTANYVVDGIKVEKTAP